MPSPSGRVLLVPWLLAVMVMLAGCDRPTSKSAGDAAPEPFEVSRPGKPGDMDVIRARGRLRVIVPANLPDGGYLPDSGSPVERQRKAAITFAESLGLDVEMVPVAGFQGLIPALRDGRGDIVAANLTVTEARRALVDFSAPLTYVREMVVTRADDDGLDAIEDLAGRTVYLDPETSYWETMEQVRKAVPSLELVAADNLGPEALIEGVASGRFDLTVLDDNTLALYLDRRDDIRAGPRVSKSRAIAWALRKDSPQLREALNHFLQRQLLDKPADDIFAGDLAGIRERRMLRVLLRNNSASYFLWKGRLMGFEYELARQYAEQLGIRLKVVVPPSHDAMLEWLTTGRGDIAAGFLVPTAADGTVAYSRHYHSAPQYVVARAGDTPLRRPADLAGRTFMVRRSSAYWETLRDFRAESGVDFAVVPAAEEVETEALIDRVARGKVDLTVADGHILDLELTWRDDVVAALALTEPRHHSWALRSASPELLKSVNAFLRETYKSTFYNLTYQKYFTDPKGIADHLNQRITRTGSQGISPYDDIVRSYAARYGFDWRFIVAQMYQESRFDPEAKSWAGARGLLQILPHTAKQLGFTDLERPEVGIHAGVKYLDWLRNRFNTRIGIADRQWLALAAYNAGLGHVYDARRLARRKGLDPDRWFGHVEQAMLLLAKPEYAEKARHGYARGGEAVRYVRDIRDRYQAYARLAQPVQVVARRSPSLVERFMRTGS